LPRPHENLTTLTRTPLTERPRVIFGLGPVRHSVGAGLSSRPEPVAREVRQQESWLLLPAGYRVPGLVPLQDLQGRLRGGSIRRRRQFPNLERKVLGAACPRLLVWSVARLADLLLRLFHPAKCFRIASACALVTTAEREAASASWTACRLPKCCSRRRVVDSPMPGTSRSSVERSRIWRRLR
jgi:hypothetical protein